ncbi:acetylcholinesterase-like [Apis florea]|uniref:acetylcholinesterase-like n=1 Tax=Apis florea TaxID=7463 RepID=UPI0012FF1401|nr:acetylcholinesterase-like [Apis florea]
MNGIIFLSIFFSVLTLNNADIQRTTVIQTNSGPVQGATLTTVWNDIEYSSFKGIPYAAPPIGNRRFRPPVPPEPWNETLDAIEEANECPQEASNVYSGNEDCLYLSVFTPQTKFDEKLTLKPVMVWIYGGSFLDGSNNASVYGPDFFMEQDVVLVTFNYRLGALGFLYLKHRNAAGNAAMRDQLMVLEWVRDNIVAFGGDPNQVTLFGQSAGSASVNYHVLSEKSRGLFHQAIEQSGTATSYLYKTQESAFQTAHKLANELGFHSKNPNELLKFFLEADAKDLVATTKRVFPFGSDFAVPFAPIKENPDLVDDPKDMFLSECPITLAASQKFNKMPVMLGFTHDELLDFSDGLYRIINNTADALKEMFNLKLDLLGPYESVKELSVVLSDFIMKGPIDFAQRLLVHGDGNYPVYYYQLSYVSNYAMHTQDGIPEPGIAHSDDIGFLFNVERLNAPTNPQHPFNQFRRKLVTLWANFAKYGNPTPANENPLNNVIWEPSGKAGRLLDMGDNFKMINRNQAINQRALFTEKYLYFSMPVTSDCNDVTYANYFSLF